MCYYPLVRWFRTCFQPHALLAAMMLMMAHNHTLGMEKVQPVDFSRITLEDFSDEELGAGGRPLTYYLANFHRLANAVVESGPNQGFIDLKVWRRAADNAPYNARIMENILSLAWFYTRDRPWNPYYGDPALKARLEAALRFWIQSQHPDGRFSEYSEGAWGLSPTGFGVRYMGETLHLLEDSEVSIDPALLKKTWAAQRKAIMAILENPSLLRHGRRFSNQFGTVWSPAIRYINRFQDTEMENAMKQRLKESEAKGDFQSPAGFFYEQDGPDWGYAFGTHLSNHAAIWNLARGTKWAPYFENESRFWWDWLSYNAFPEPDYSTFILNRAIQTRQTEDSVSNLADPLAEVIETARAFSPTDAVMQSRRERTRAQVAESWPDQSPLEEGFNTFPPYSLLHHGRFSWFPSTEEREQARHNLPYNRSDSFTHQRVDSRNPFVFTYVRRPGYYAVFNSGKQIRSGKQTRHGFGLFAHPDTGVLMQAWEGGWRSANRENFSWGTRADANDLVYEADNLEAAFLIGDELATHQPEPGVHDLEQGPVIIKYDLGENGTKTIVFEDAGILVDVQHPGNFIEEFPLLVNDPVIVEMPRRLVFQQNERQFILEFDGAESWTLEEFEGSLAGRRFQKLTVKARDNLSYTMSIQ